MDGRWDSPTRTPPSLQLRGLTPVALACHLSALHEPREGAWALPEPWGFPWLAHGTWRVVRVRATPVM
jgi:hypothetical protein